MRIRDARCVRVAASATATRSRPRAGHCITTTALSTSAPPSSCNGESDSPNAAAASPTVTTGSSVDRIDAALGPTRASPAKNSRIAPTVLTTTMPAIASQPSAESARSGPPRGIDAEPERQRRPAHTSAASASGGTPAPTRSPARM